MHKQQIKAAVIGAAKRLRTGNDEHETYGMDVEILRKNAFSEDIAFLARAVRAKIHRRKAA